MSLNKGGEGSSINEDASARSRLLMTTLLFFAVVTGLYTWGADNAVGDIERIDHVVQKTRKSETTPSSSLPPPTIPPSVVAPVATSNAATETLAPTVDPNAASDPSTEPPISEGQGTSSGGGDFDKACSDLCTKREANRKEKFGGDLLDFQDISNLAEAAHKKVQAKLREDYGEYFDKMFINGTNPDGGTRYYGMKGPDEGNGPSRERMKRKLKIKVLKMMASIKATESNINGCDCIGKTGSVNGEVDDDISNSIPEFYEKYVFANGGHSNAAGHGNMYSETYTAVFGRDLRPIWEAIGVEMIDRNYAMGAMGATPVISMCSKEIFGADVDFLTWNYAMTDPKPESAAHYVYRGALIPSRPAIVFVSAKWGPKVAKTFEEVGLAMFDSKTGGTPVKELPDMTPDGIPLTEAEASKIPMMARNLKCNGRVEGKEVCFKAKFSCGYDMQKAGVDCICPNVGKRSSWHMGYRAHALEGHLIALPFIEMLLEALQELAAVVSTDAGQLLAGFQEEEDKDFRQFMESPLVGIGDYTQYATMGEPTDELFETWFRGQSICRTPYLPSQSRFLGITTESEKTGDVAMFGHETYDTGFYTVLTREKKRTYDFDFEDKEPPAGKFSVIAGPGAREGWRNFTKFQEECPAVVHPDYKDTFYAPLLDRKASITIPNQMEKDHYGYDPKRFKGVVAIQIKYAGAPCKKGCHDYNLGIDDFLDKNFTITVNSKPVKEVRVVSAVALILQGDGGNPYWEPDPQTKDYTIEFEVAPEVDYQLLFGDFVLM